MSLNKVTTAMLDLKMSASSDSIEEFKCLLGDTFKVYLRGNEVMVFENSKANYIFYHEQSCCESVLIYEVVGDIEDLNNSPILQAEKVTHRSGDENEGESKTWTFYKFATIKGSVVVRWIGESNGYYSEEVNFSKI